MNTTSLALLLTAPFLASALPFHGEGDGDESWPQWRGPDRDGVSRATAWLPEGKAEHLWETEVGLGYSSVSVADGRLYTMGYDRDLGMDLVFCLDATTGEEIWVHAYPAEIWNEAHTGGTLTTPTIDGDVVFTLNREGNLYALEAGSGEVIWHVPLLDVYELTPPRWGFSASPLVLGDDELIVNAGSILSVDKSNGEVLWMSKDYGGAYSTPAAFEHEGKPALAVLNAGGVAVLDRTNGEEKAFLEGSNPASISGATPIVIEDAVFVSTDLTAGAALLAIADDELIPVWENRVMRNSNSGCVLMDEHLYGFDQAVLKCVGLDGEERWAERGIGNGAVTGAGDRLILTSSRGELIVAAASAEGYEELSRAKLFDAGNHWTKPVLVNGLIYARNSEGTLICRDHRIVAKD
jgi:outer membrane protein assembly factor BamB